MTTGCFIVTGLTSLWLIFFSIHMAMCVREERRRQREERELHGRAGDLNDGSIQAAIEMSVIRTRVVCYNRKCRRYNGSCSMDCISVGEDGRCTYCDEKGEDGK